MTLCPLPMPHMLVLVTLYDVRVPHGDGHVELVSASCAYGACFGGLVGSCSNASNAGVGDVLVSSCASGWSWRHRIHFHCLGGGFVSFQCLVLVTL